MTANPKIDNTYCGMYCGACFIRIAHEQNRPDCIPEPWRTRAKDRDLECLGCKSDKVYFGCAGCDIRACAKGKQLDYCFNCVKYPCEKIQKLESHHLPHHDAALQHVSLLKADKLKEWIEFNQSRFKCQNCGNIHSWYEEFCFYCGNKVLSVIEEQKTLLND